MSKGTGSDPRVVVVTGASSGIGQAASRMFAARGCRVALVARRRERLDRLRDELVAAGGEALALQADLTAEDETDAVLPKVVETWGRLDVLVNNAGYGVQQRFEDMPPEAVARMFRLNVLSAMALSRAALGPMRASGGGSIVNVASVGGVVAHPLNVAYCASKHALVGFSKSLRLECLGTGVRVTAVCPGSTRTEFFDVAKRDIPFDGMIERWSVPPEKVARAIVRAADGNRALVFPTWSAWFLFFADRWLSPLSQRGNVRYRDRVLARTAGPGDAPSPKS